MTEFYEPTLLFRQNAMKRYSCPLSPIASVSTLDVSSTLTGSSEMSRLSKTVSPQWMLNQNNPKDTEVLSKTCALNRLNIKSNYWQIPDNDMNLTAMAINKKETDTPIMAISSGNREQNLYIYELDILNNYLTHHNTISLPNIHSMKWVPDTNTQNSKYLLTGNNKGYAHLVSIPTPNLYKTYTLSEEDEENESAEIVKRFNHRKHLKSINKNPSLLAHQQTNITKLGFSKFDKNLLSIYDDNLFLWDMKQVDSLYKPKPIMISSINGLTNFDITSTSENVIGVCGKFGVSLFDTRDPKFSVPSLVIKSAGRKKLSANIMRWSDNNAYVFASGHIDGNIRLWDVRKQDCFATLHGHQLQVTNLEWNQQDLFSGANDGNIIHWDLTSDIKTGDSFSDDSNKLKNCSLKEGIDSVKFNPQKNSLQDKLLERQCGTTLPASNTKIVGMSSVKGSDSDDLKILSIDGSSFFGVHSKIYEAVNVNINTEKLYYTKEDVALLVNEHSNSTLLNSCDSIDQVTKPLAISRKPTTKLINNDSEDTLLSHEPQQIDYKLDINVDDFDHEDDYEDPDSSQEFNFNSNTIYETPNNDSVYSVDLQPRYLESPNISTDETTNTDFDASIETLSTNPTIMEQPVPEKETPEVFTDFPLLAINFDDDEDVSDDPSFSNTNIYHAIAGSIKLTHTLHRSPTTCTSSSLVYSL